MGFWQSLIFSKALVVLLLFLITFTAVNVLNLKVIILTILKATIEWHTVQSPCGTTIALSSSRTLPSAPMETLQPGSSCFSLPTLPHPLEITNLLSVSMNLPLLDISKSGNIQYVAFMSVSPRQFWRWGGRGKGNFWCELKPLGLAEDLTPCCVASYLLWSPLWLSVPDFWEPDNQDGNQRS